VAFVETLTHQDIASSIFNILNGVAIRGQRITPGSINVVRQSSAFSGYDELYVTYNLTSPTDNYQGHFVYLSPAPGVTPPISCIFRINNGAYWFQSPFDTAPRTDLFGAYGEMFDRLSDAMNAWWGGTSAPTAVAYAVATGRSFPCMAIITKVFCDGRDTGVLCVVAQNAKQMGPTNPLTTGSLTQPFYQNSYIVHPQNQSGGQQLLPDLEIGINNGSSIYSVSSNTFTQP
jgi:hypothetical protein